MIWFFLGILGFFVLIAFMFCAFVGMSFAVGKSAYDTMREHLGDSYYDDQPPNHNQ